MRLKRLGLMLLVGACAASPAWAGPATEVVRPFYDDLESYVPDEANRDSFIAPAVTKFEEDEKQSSDNEGVGCIDFALQLDAQDFDEGEVAKTLAFDEEVSGDEATVTANFKLFPDNEDPAQKVVWSLRKVGADWKIYDIASGSGQWRLSEFDCTNG